MGGEGVIAGAMASIKNNRALLKKRKIREIKDLLYEASGRTALEFREVSPAELNRIKMEIRKQARKAILYELLAYVCAFVLACLIIWFLIWIFSP